MSLNLQDWRHTCTCAYVCQNPRCADTWAGAYLVPDKKESNGCGGISCFIFFSSIFNVQRNYEKNILYIFNTELLCRPTSDSQPACACFLASTNLIQHTVPISIASELLFSFSVCYLSKFTFWLFRNWLWLHPFATLGFFIPWPSHRQSANNNPVLYRTFECIF